MVKVGTFNKLQVVKELDFGVYLDGGELDTILLPKCYVHTGCVLGEWIDVFLYIGADDLLIDNTDQPKVQMG